MRHTILSLAAASLLVASSSCQLIPFGSKTSPPPPPPPSAPTPPPAPGSDPAGTPATPPPATGDAIAEFPDYPGASKTGYGTETKSTGIRQTKVKFTTQDTFDSVKAYYEKLIADGGWRIVKVQQKAGEIEWDLSKGTSMVDVDVESKFGGMVEISVERKDR